MAALLLSVGVGLVAALSDRVLLDNARYRLTEQMESRRMAVRSSIDAQQHGIAVCAEKIGPQQGELSELVQQLPRLFYEVSSADRVALTDMKGVGLNIHGEHTDISGSEAYQEILAGTRSAVCVYELPDGGGENLMMAHVVHREDGEDLILAAAYQVEDISEYLLRSAGAVNDSCLLIDREGNVLMRAGRSERAENLIEKIRSDDSANEQSAQMLSGELGSASGGVVSYIYHGEKWYCAFAELGINDWLLAYRVNAVELEYVQRVLRTYLLVLYIVLLAALLGVAALFGLREERVRREKRLDDQSLRASRECLRILAGHPGAILCDTDLRTNKTYLYGNFMSVLGRDPVLTNFPFDAVRVGMIGEDDAKRIGQTMHSARHGTERAQTDISVRNADGSLRWCRLRAYAMRDEAGEPYRIICRILDQSDSARSAGPASAPEDASMMSRIAAQRRMEEKIRAGSCALILVDIDNPAGVAEKLGNEQSEKLMAQIGRELVRTAGAEEIVARLGGDEFAVLIPGVPDEAALRERSNRLQSCIARVGYEYEVALSSSVGTAASGGEAGSFDELYFQADTAQYMAKQSGRKKSLIYRED
ncbi:MAG: diguanylate cyclase [Eubacteriales bacterium]|nr:diguanylate cyclase [Eubacteriales bacterium]